MRRLALFVVIAGFAVAVALTLRARASTSATGEPVHPPTPPPDVAVTQPVVPPVAEPAPASASGRTWHVALGGDDAGPGTLERPFRTIQRAATAAQAGDICEVAAGTYRETVRPAMSGEDGRPITFRAAQGAAVIVSGAEPVTGWSRDGAVFRAILPTVFASAMNQADQVFVDGTMVQAARFPDYGADLAKPRMATVTKAAGRRRDGAENWTYISFEDEALPLRPDDWYVGLGIRVLPLSNGWSWPQVGTVVAHTHQRLTVRTRCDTGSGPYQPGSRYALFGAALLDHAGEWSLDRGTRELRLRSPSDTDPSGQLVEIKMRDHGFDLDERSWIVIAGIDLFACSITTDRAAGGDAVAYDDNGWPRRPWRSTTVDEAASTGVIVERVRARYLDHFTDVSGHPYLQWGQGTGIVLSGTGHVIRDCELRDSAGNGITLLGRGCRAENCQVTGMAYASPDCAAISTGGAGISLDHEIASCTIERCARAGILLRNLANSDPEQPRARVHHNDISDCMLQDRDGGGIYLAGQDAAFLRIDHNRIHGLRAPATAGIYIDWAKSVTIDHNLIWDATWGIAIQGDRDGRSDVLCYRNTIAVAPPEQGEPAVAFAGTVGQNIGTAIIGNITGPWGAAGCHPLGEGFGRATVVDNLFWEGATGSTNDPQWRDAAAADFTLQLGSPAIDRARTLPTSQQWPYEQDLGDDAAGPAADAGAFEAGSPPWSAGRPTSAAPLR
ncbi:MAG: right-handed parallel beta-helix repeat-containing protein [Planctomycetes bacterium]|nr:right-handed parallel beta-helix repeat-containing protein [Planctomycetota bacterium]